MQGIASIIKCISQHFTNTCGKYRYSEHNKVHFTTFGKYQWCCRGRRGGRRCPLLNYKSQNHYQFRDYSQ